MIFEETRLKGAFVIRPERLEDERGFYARTFCLREFAEQGLNAIIAQSSISFNKKKGTFRGMHFQIPPWSEIKIISCTRGSALCYIIDLRPGSGTFGQWISVEVTSDNKVQIYAPQLFAHGFITLEEKTEMLYQMTQFYKADASRGFRWDDPKFNIQLPFPVEAISEKDKSWPPFDYPSALLSIIPLK